MIFLLYNPARTLLFRTYGGLLKEIILVVAALAATGTTAAIADPLIGTFVSESRENFGSDDPGEFRLEITKQSQNYRVQVFHKGAPKGGGELVPCDTKKEGYLNNRAPGPALALCNEDRGMQHPFFSYAENGITVTRPHGPPETRVYKTKYYARMGWAIRGFKKI